jgi:hypothetical protein
MKIKISKKFLTLTVSGLLLIASLVVLACSDYDFPDFYRSFFAPETSHLPESKPFYRSLNVYYGDNEYLNVVNTMDSSNLNEWREFFNTKVTTDDLQYLVYQSRIGEIDTCIFYLKNSEYPINSRLRANSLLAYPDKALAKEFLFYLGFAKRCEPYASYAPGWWDEDEVDPRNDKGAMQKLVNGGKKAMINARTPFIQERYAFQVIRMLYQLGLYDDCIHFYDAYKNIFASKTTIPYRALGYVAASHYKLTNYGEANYLYAILYDNCEAMRKTCVRSFHPQEEADWNDALALAKNTREKELMWHLLGLYVDPLRAMKEIYALNPKSDQLDLLLVRAVNINEELFNINSDPSGEETGTTYLLNKQLVDSSLVEFSKQVADKGNTIKPYLWNLTTGYLQLVLGNYNEAEKYLAKAQSTSNSDILVNEQIRAFRLISLIEQYTSIDAKTEKALAKELNWIGIEERHPSLRSSSIYGWSLSRLCEKYRNWGDTIKAQCLDYNQNKQFYDNEKNIDAIIRLMDKPSKTEFEKFIVGVHAYSESELYTYKAIKRIYQFKFQEALNLLNANPNTKNDDFPADPFLIHINDCHDCDFLAEKEKVYNLTTFVEQLIELQTKAETDPMHAAENYFLLANGLYNMTYFGNSRIAYYTPITEYNVGQTYYDYRSENNQIFDCSEAMKYYQKAMDASNNKEFKAKCCFMAAKCEQNHYFTTVEDVWDTPIYSGKYYKLLRTDYSKTKYVQEVIDECGYFRKYMGIKDKK